MAVCITVSLFIQRIVLFFPIIRVMVAGAYPGAVVEAPPGIVTSLHWAEGQTTAMVEVEEEELVRLGATTTWKYPRTATAPIIRIATIAPTAVEALVLIGNFVWRLSDPL